MQLNLHLKIGLSLLLILLIISGFRLQEQTTIAEPVLFCLVPPPLNDRSTFGHMAESFNNQDPTMGSEGSPRGGDLMLLNTNGTIRNLTQEAGFGVASGQIQAENAIAVREPNVHWDGCRALFSMLIGGPVEAFDKSAGTQRWQMYEITNLCDVINGEVANIERVNSQPSSYNNLSPIYGIKEGEIYFISDQPYGGFANVYPPLDEYESTPTNSGIWKLDVNSNTITHLTHSPSGDFDLFFASDGRLLFTRWAHTKEDGEAIGWFKGTKTIWEPFNYISEESNEIENAPEMVDGKPFADTRGVRLHFFPEPGNDGAETYDPDRREMKFNEFQIWEIFENGERNQTINHIGRQEFGGASTGGSFIDDNNLTSYLEAGSQYTANSELRSVVRGFNGFFQVTEDPREGSEGNFYFSYGPEFGAFASGLLLKSYIPMDLNPQDALMEEVVTNTAYELGRFRDPIILSNGTIIAAHTTESGRFNRDEGRELHFQLTIVEEDNFSRNPFSGEGFTKEIVYWGDSEIPISITLPLMELWPEVVRARDRPTSLPIHQVDPIEESVIQEEDVNVDELRNWLIENNLALISIRNITSRDVADRQQPFNLKVPGGVESISSLGGTEYEISHFQPVQYEHLRTYFDEDGDEKGGRRPFLLPFRNTSTHSNIENINPYDIDGPENSIEIESDGSVALFVPATRAVSWWTKSPLGEPIVIERQPLSFAPGEIMACPGCHGINRTDQAGNLPPTNKPQSLRKLMTFWKNRFGPNPLGFDENSRLGENGYYLYQNTPNPFDGVTTIKYEVPYRQHVQIVIYNLNGQKIKTLLDKEVTQGTHVVSWDGSSEMEQPSDGIFICSLITNEAHITNKIILRSK